MKNAYEQRRLKYVATLNDEVLPESTAPYHELQYLDIGNVTSAGTIQPPTTYAFADAPSRARRKVQAGDVIVSTVRTYLQAIAPIENPPPNLIVSTGFAVVRPRADLFSSRYAKYALREASFLAEVERRSTGVSYPAINASDLGDIRLPLPSLPEQEAIADYLDRETARLDQLTAARQRQLALLDAKRRALIAQAVTQGLDAGAPRRPSGLPWLGEVPGHWEVVQLKRLCEKVLTGSTPKNLEEMANAEATVNWFTPGDLTDDEISLTDSVRKLSATLLEDEALSWFPARSVLVVGVGATLGKVGILTEAGSANQQLNALLPKEGVSPWFVAYQVQALRSVLFASSLASTLPILSQQRMGEIKVTMPPLAEQERIVSFIEQESAKINQLHAAITRSLTLLEKKRASLITAAVTGLVVIKQPSGSRV